MVSASGLPKRQQSYNNWHWILILVKINNVILCFGFTSFLWTVENPAIIHSPSSAAVSHIGTPLSSCIRFFWATLSVSAVFPPPNVSLLDYVGWSSSWFEIFPILTHPLFPVVSVPFSHFYNLWLYCFDICPFSFPHTITLWRSTSIFLHQEAFVYSPVLLGRFTLPGDIYYSSTASQKRSSRNQTYCMTVSRDIANSLGTTTKYYEDRIIMICLSFPAHIWYNTDSIISLRWLSFAKELRRGVPWEKTIWPRQLSRWF